MRLRQLGQGSRAGLSRRRSTRSSLRRSQHEGDEGAIGYSSESHFRVTSVSDSFEGSSKVERQREAMKVLKDELRPAAEGGSVHELSLSCRTPAELAKQAEREA